jgi:hypothetical protein
LQLLQPFFGLALAATLLGESVTWGMLAVTVAVILCVVGARRFARYGNADLARFARARMAPTPLASSQEPHHCTCRQYAGHQWARQ